MEKTIKYDWSIDKVEQNNNGVRLTFNSGETLFIADILLHEILSKYSEKSIGMDNYFYTNDAFSDLIIKDKFRVSKEVSK